MRYVTIEAKTQEFLWHGTNDKNLRSILSKGLTPEGKYRKAQYTKGYLKSIHGIYLATSPLKAIDYANLSSSRGNDSILVLVKVSYDNENFAVDEDTLYKHRFKDKNNKADLQLFIDYYLDKIKPSAHKSFIYTCNKNKNLILDWINYYSKDSATTTDEIERDYVRKVTLLLGKFLTSKIKKWDSYHKHDENWKNVATNKAITYKGATRIIGIWGIVNRVGTTLRYFVQIYGDKKYNTLIKQLQRSTEIRFLEDFYGIDDFYLVRDLFKGNKINWNEFVRKHKKLPTGLSNLGLDLGINLNYIPEGFEADRLILDKDITELPKGMKIRHLDLSLNEHITRLPDDIQVKELVTNEKLENIPVKELDYLRLNSHTCVQDAVDMKIKKLAITFPISELPDGLQELDMSNCYQEVSLPKNMWNIRCRFGELQRFLPDGFKTKTCDLSTCDYMEKLPNNLTCEYLYVPHNLEKLSENLTTETLVLYFSKVTEIPKSARIKKLYINKVTSFPVGFTCDELHLSGIKKELLNLDNCRIKEIV